MSVRVDGDRGAVAVMVVRMGVRMGVPSRAFVAHRELRGGYPRSDHALGRDDVGIHCKRPERATQVIKRQPGIDQRSENHVARGARKAVEVQQLHARPSYPVHAACSRLLDPTRDPPGLDE